MKACQIRVPGSTANLGPGFDSIGLAVNRYLTLDAKPAENWRFQYVQQEYLDLPTDETNLIYKSMVFALNHLEVELENRACEIVVHSDIPLARGLGTSAAATVAGIELANILYNLHLTIEEKTRIGSLYEGHPDNIGASLYGGLTIASHTEEETFIVPCGSLPLDLLIVVPETQLLTSISRGKLPETLSFREAVKASSYANVLIAALLKGDLETAGAMMKRDLFHQPYRRQLVPQIDAMMSFIKPYKQCGAALSGAGPSVLLFLEKGKAKVLQPELRAHFPSCLIEELEPDREGLSVSFK